MLKELCEKYCSNIRVYNSLENYDYKKLSSGQEVLAELKKNTEAKHKIYTEQNDILEQLKEVLRNTEQMNSDTYEILQGFAVDLSQSEIEMDNAVAFLVQQALLAYGEREQNYDVIAEALFWCGICEWKYYKIDDQRPDCTYFEKMNSCEAYLPKLSPQSRRRYICGIINQLLYYTNKAAGPLLSKGREVLTKLSGLERDYPDTPINFKAFYSIIYRNLLTAEKSFRERIDLTAENTHYVYETALRSMALIGEKQDTSIPFDTVYYMDLYMAEFHDRQIDIGTFLKKVEPLCVPQENCSVKENHNRVFHNTAVYIDYLRLYSEQSREEIMQDIYGKVEAVFRFISRVERNEDSFYVSEYIFQFIKSTMEVLPFPMLRELFFRTTISLHKETCVHNLMAAELSKIILREVIDKDPAALIGVMDLSSREEIVKNKERLLQTMEDMALVHDLGKYKCVSIISNACRKLDDREFGIIKRHPQFGYDLIRKADVPDALKEGVLLHHRWHNGQGGYPQGYPITCNQPLIDILSIADSLEAATDPFGRSYAEPKTLEAMLEEFDGWKDTRYAAFAAEAMQHPMVRLKLNYALHRTREDIISYISRKDYQKVISFYPTPEKKMQGNRKKA